MPQTEVSNSLLYLKYVLTYFFEYICFDDFDVYQGLMESIVFVKAIDSLNTWPLLD